MKRILLDVDPGHDDALAIIMAGGHPDIKIEGITVVAGNQTLDRTLNNTVNICSHLNLDVEIAGGMEGPILRDKIIAKGVYGQSGLAGVRFKEANLKVENLHGVNYLIKKLWEAEEKLTMVTTGPLTNLAMALRICPGIVNKIDRLIMMGGSSGGGNISQKAEFNIFADPEAAYIVAGSDLEIVMIGLDVTERVCLTEEVMNRLKKIDTGAGRLSYDMMKFYRDSQKDRMGIEDPALHDPITIAYLISDDLLELKDMELEIILDKGDSYGQTKFTKASGKGKSIKLAVDIDLEVFWNLLYDILGEYK